jgi:hypothetical protein
MGTLHWLFSTKTGTLPPLNGYITGKKAICDNGLLSLKYLNGCSLKETTTHKKSAQKGTVVVFFELHTGAFQSDVVQYKNQIPPNPPFSKGGKNTALCPNRLTVLIPPFEKGGLG